MLYFREKHNITRMICAESLSEVKLGRMSHSLPDGKIKIFTMYPMDFEEFLVATGNEMLRD